MNLDNITYHLGDKALRIEKVGLLFLEKRKINPLQCEMDDRRHIIENELSSINNSIIEYSHSFDSNIQFSDIVIPNGKSIFLLFNVICNDNQAAVMLSSSSTNYIVYNNYNLIGLRYFAPLVTTRKLTKGNNYFIFEFDEANRDSYISIRINKYENEIVDNYSSMLSSNYCVDNQLLRLIDTGTDLSEKQFYEFILLPNNTIDIDISQIVEAKIIDSRKGLLHKFRCKLSIPKKISIKKYKNTNYDEFSYLTLEFSYNYKDKNLIERVNLFINKIPDILSEVKNKANYCLGNLPLDNVDKNNLEGILYNIENIDHTDYFQYLYFNNAVNTYIQNKNIIDYWKDEGFNRIYYKSKVDNSMQLLRMFLPHGYKADRKYPLLVGVETSGAHYSYSFRRFQYEPAICIDVSLRGITLGSYFGETSVLEAIEFIKGMFNIDEDRIYLFGYSNGAYAAWLIAQYHPHMFAGILSVGGCPDLSCIDNISNIRVLNVTSMSDSVYQNSYVKPNIKLKNFEKYKGILIDNMKHGEISIMLYNQNYYIDLLHYKRDLYPSEINYKTFRNRHNKAYWIELHSIQYGKRSSEVHAEIIDASHITVEIDNATGFTIQIPPQINKKSFSVKINDDYQFDFINYYNNEIHFSNSNNKYKIIENKPDMIISKKGTGILDIYMKELSIIVPDMSSEIIRNVARTFSNPKTNGYIKETYVNYPVIYQDQVQDCNITNNLVIIDLTSNNYNLELLQLVRNCMPIITDSNGYSYKGRYYTCKYVIMQAVPNPYNLDSTVLVIESNEEKMFQKNLFTRNLVIPSYLNGVHPYLNNEALIFANNNYYGIYEWGNDIIEIK